MTLRPSIRLAIAGTALAVVAAACGSSNAATPETQTESTATTGAPTTSAPVETSAATTTPDRTDSTGSATTTTTTTGGESQPGAGSDDSFVCTEVLGFSQAGSERNGGWFTVGGFEGLPGIDDGAWQLRWRSSAEAVFWVDPDFDGWRDGRLFSACETPAVDRVIVFFLHRARDVTEYEEPIREVAAALSDRYPDLRQVVIEPMVGGPGEQLCTVPSRGGTVFSSEAHRWVDEAVATVADGFIVAGASPEVESCEQFVDKPGHLSPEGAAAVARWMADYYGG